MKYKIIKWYLLSIDYLSKRSLIILTMLFVMVSMQYLEVLIDNHYNIIEFIFLSIFLFYSLLKMLKTDYYKKINENNINWYKFIEPEETRNKFINFTFKVYFSLLVVIINVILFSLEYVFKYDITIYMYLFIFFTGYFTIDNLIFGRYNKYSTHINSVQLDNLNNTEVVN